VQFSHAGKKGGTKPRAKHPDGHKDAMLFVSYESPNVLEPLPVEHRIEVRQEQSALEAIAAQAQLRGRDLPNRRGVLPSVAAKDVHGRTGGTDRCNSSRSWQRPTHNNEKSKAWRVLLASNVFPTQPRIPNISPNNFRRRSSAVKKWNLNSNILNLE
jgi:hypothetical protein